MEYLKPKNLPEALVLIQKLKVKTSLLAGGTNVIPDRRANVIKPNALFGISHFKSLSSIKDEF
jgi:CO/xanthine dehydrogenase FAD-binding subunit